MIYHPVVNIDHEVIKLQNAYGRCKKVRDTYWKILLDCKINRLPIDTIEMTSKTDMVVLKNSEINGLSKNESGISYFHSEQWYIIYDDTMPKGRIRFTVAHEFGHIFLGHELVGRHRRIFDLNKPRNEVEADIFASRLLAPACVLCGLNVTTADEIMELCVYILSSC